MNNLQQRRLKKFQYLFLATGLLLFAVIAPMFKNSVLNDAVHFVAGALCGAGVTSILINLFKKR